MTYLPLAKRWKEVKARLATEGAENVLYDSDLNALIDLTAIPNTLTGKDADSVDGYHGADLEKIANKGVANGYCELDANARISLERFKLEALSLFANGAKGLIETFTVPTLFFIGSRMTNLLNIATKVEFVAGNITATDEELTIVGGSPTAKGDSWVYFDLPEPATKIYIRVFCNSVNAHITMIAPMNSAGSVHIDDSAAYGYHYFILVPAAANDLRLEKKVGGVPTVLASEAVNLAYGTYYDLEIYIDVNEKIKCWRDGVLKFSVTPDTANIPSINSLQLFVRDVSTTVAQSGKFKGQVVVIYE